jgi:PhnB protein
MTTVNIYLTFNGNCRKAFEFYKNAFGGDFSYVGTFGEMPPGEDRPILHDSEKDKIMHMSLPISKETALMGSDSFEVFGEPAKNGTNFSISINTDTIEEADDLFNKLSEGGKVTMPLDKTFWSPYFGMFTDKFGVSWMVNVEQGENV